jgi:hypothetical protein
VSAGKLTSGLLRVLFRELFEHRRLVVFREAPVSLVCPFGPRKGDAGATVWPETDVR